MCVWVVVYVLSFVVSRRLSTESPFPIPPPPQITTETHVRAAGHLVELDGEVRAVGVKRRDAGVEPPAEAGRLERLGPVPDEGAVEAVHLAAAEDLGCVCFVGRGGEKKRVGEMVLFCGC